MATYQHIECELLKMKLQTEATGILTKLLQPNQMVVFYHMERDVKLPENVTKQDLIKVIGVLCKKLNWFELTEQTEEINGSSNVDMNFTKEAFLTLKTVTRKK